MKIEAIRWNEEYAYGLSRYLDISLRMIEAAIGSAQLYDSDEEVFLVTTESFFMGTPMRSQEFITEAAFEEKYAWVTKEIKGAFQPVYRQ